MLVKFIDVALPVHNVCVAGVAVAVGNGFTVITTVIGLDVAQLLAEEEIVYVTVPGLAPDVVKVCEIIPPLPADAPVTPDCTIVQENVAPLTLLLKGIEVDVPEQIVVAAGVADTLGIGFTVIVNAGIVEVHPAAVVAVTL